MYATPSSCGHTFFSSYPCLGEANDVKWASAYSFRIVSTVVAYPYAGSTGYLAGRTLRRVWLLQHVPTRGPANPLFLLHQMHPANLDSRTAGQSHILADPSEPDYWTRSFALLFAHQTLQSGQSLMLEYWTAPMATLGRKALPIDVL